MRRIFHPRLALHHFCLFSVAALSLLAGGTPLTNVFAQNGSDKPHSVTITWNASSSPVAGYNVYRALPPATPVKLTKKVVAGTRYIDKAVRAGQTYSYSVTAVDIKGVESAPSGIITVTIPSDGASPAKP